MILAVNMSMTFGGRFQIKNLKTLIFKIIGTAKIRISSPSDQWSQVA